MDRRFIVENINKCNKRFRQMICKDNFIQLADINEEKELLLNEINEMKYLIHDKIRELRRLCGANKDDMAIEMLIVELNQYIDELEQKIQLYNV